MNHTTITVTIKLKEEHLNIGEVVSEIIELLERFRVRSFGVEVSGVEDAFNSEEPRKKIKGITYTNG